MAQTDGAAAAARAARLDLEGLLSGLDLSLPDDFLGRAELFVELLLRANARLNLTRVVQPTAVARLHLLDALAALPLLDALAPKTALDLGSGGGVPGIPLALARPDVQWTLVDSVAKKVDALRAFVESLGLGNVAVIAERAEVLGQSPMHRECYRFVAARAVAPLPVLVELALPLVAIDGLLVAWKGPLSEDDAEVRRGGAAAAGLGGGTLQVRRAREPVLGGHTFILVRKDRPTPAAYPRRPGVPARRPLG